MLPFHKIYWFFYKSFKIQDDTKIIEDLEKQKIKRVLVIKRSWIYWLIISWILPVTTLISWINVYNAYHIFDTLWIKYIVITLQCLLTLWLLYSSIRYLYDFKKLYGNTNGIMDVEVVKQSLHKWDQLFTSFFNQITLNILLFTLLIVLNVIHIFYNLFWSSSTSFSEAGFAVFDISCLVAQLILMRRYRKKMVDLEMDFNIVQPHKIFFINQSWMLSSSQTLQSEKIKTIKSTTWNFFMSFFNLWTIIVLTEGDSWAVWVMEMYYVSDPGQTVKNINTIINEEIEYTKNVYLKQILDIMDIWYKDWESSENLSKIKQFLIDNDDGIRHDYEQWDLIKRKTITDMYHDVDEAFKKLNK